MIPVWALVYFLFTAALSLPLGYLWIFTSFVRLQIYPSALHKDKF